MASRNSQGTGDENAGDPVAAGRGRDLKSPTHGQSPKWRPEGTDNVSDNNAHRGVFPMDFIDHPDRR
jgi:hypothetical protein